MPQPTQAQFAELFAARARHLRRAAYLLCGDWTHAEDLVQTAFVRVYAAWPGIRDLGAVDAYLRRTLTHVYLDDARRHWSREIATEVLPDTVPSMPAATEERIVLLRALASVPPRQRACLVLRYFEDCSVEETAAAMGCSPGTVKSNTARGLEALRTQLGDQPDLMIRSTAP